MNVVAVQPHARLYKGIPPVHRSRRPWLIAAAGFAVISGVVAVLVIQVHHSFGVPAASSYSGRPTRTIDLSPMFDRYTLTWTLAALFVGGVAALALVRGWWSMFVIDVVGLAGALGLFVSNSDVFYRAMFAWPFWVFGVSAGAAVDRLLRRRRLRAAALG
jgi:hypothetical protein